MGYHTETVSSIADLITKLDTWMAANGWTAEHLDTTTTVTTGGEWAMRRTFGATNLRFAASWDAANSGVNLAIYQYVDQNYVIADRPWGQDHDSGNGFAGSTPDASIAGARHVILAAAPIRYHVWEGRTPADYTYVAVETAAGEFAHFGFGVLDKQGGDWDGGEFVYGQRNYLGAAATGAANFDGMSFLLDGHLNDTLEAGGPSNGAELLAATIHCESMPNQPAGGMWGISAGGSTAGHQTDFGTDRQSNDGVSSDVDRVLFTWGLRAGPFAQGFQRSAGFDLSGEMRLWPVAVTYVDPSTSDIHGCPIGYMPNAFGCNLQNYVAGDTVQDEDGNTYRLFPAQKKWPGSGAGTSGYLGIAYKEPLLLPPSSYAQCSAWIDFSDTSTHTEVSGNLSQVDDKSGNGNHAVQATAGERPTTTTVSGMTMGDFDGVDENMTIPNAAELNPEAETFTIFVVYRSSDANEGALVNKGNNPASPRYGSFLTSGTDIIVNVNDNAGSGDVFTQDNTRDWSNGAVKLLSWQIDRVSNTHRIWDGREETADSGLDISSVGSLSNSQDVFFGVHQQANNFPFLGQIGEVVLLKGALSTTEFINLQTYLLEKWSI